ncbi:MAG: hypothetical protein ACFFD4_33135 [Candidatus Odinarchaeota archaeon]
MPARHRLKRPPVIPHQVPRGSGFQQAIQRDRELLHIIQHVVPRVVQRGIKFFNRN